jgi:hypothetical protein
VIAEDIRDLQGLTAHAGYAGGCSQVSHPSQRSLGPLAIVPALVPRSAKADSLPGAKEMGTRPLGHRLIHRWCELIVPWTVHEYPGEDRMLAAICSIAISSALAYLKPSRHRPRKHAVRLVDYLEAHASQELALALELRAYAQDRTLVKNC